MLVASQLLVVGLDTAKHCRQFSHAFVPFLVIQRHAVSMMTVLFSLLTPACGEFHFSIFATELFHLFNGEVRL